MPSTEAREETLGGSELAHRVVDVLVDRQAADVVLLDLTSLAAFTDYFVIATADNERHMRALLDALGRELAVGDAVQSREEGQPASGWVLVDLGDVVVHVFTDERRAYYDLEGLWRRAQEVVRVQ